ncbi:MAG: hypothetical protein GPOALKHO_000059 [Sodalis sp.]|nr:MAG: hypothetical protein GPOALKHO_000059 [Sodalis sp.]
MIIKDILIRGGVMSKRIQVPSGPEVMEYVGFTPADPLMVRYR